MKRLITILVGVAAFIALLGVILIGVRREVRGNPAARPAQRNSAEWRARHQVIADRLQQGHAGVLWIGDSIVERWEGPGQAIWDRYYVPRDAVNMGISSDHTEYVLWRLEHCPLERVSPKLAIVMIGQDNTGWCSADQIAGGVSAVVTELRQKLPAMKILLLGVFYRGESSNDERAELAATNVLLAKLEDHEHVFYLDINSIFENPDGTIRQSLMPDFEHPSEEGYRVWAKAIEPKVAELLGEPPIDP